jgi:hypothetical protein
VALSLSSQETGRLFSSPSLSEFEDRGGHRIVLKAVEGVGKFSSDEVRLLLEGW